MNADKMRRLEKLLERKLSEDEKDRLRTIGRVLGVSFNTIRRMPWKLIL